MTSIQRPYHLDVASQQVAMQYKYIPGHDSGCTALVFGRNEISRNSAEYPNISLKLGKVGHQAHAPIRILIANSGLMHEQQPTPPYQI